MAACKKPSEKASGGTVDSTEKLSSDSGFVLVESGLKSPGKIPLTSSGSMSAEDALALFQSLGVARITKDGGEDEAGRKKPVEGGEEVMFDMEITATNEEPQSSLERRSCGICDFVGSNQIDLKRHMLVKHGMIGEVKIEKSDISVSVVKGKPGDVAKGPKPSTFGSRRYQEPAKDSASRGQPKADDHAGTLICLSSSKFADTSIELIESGSESLLKMPVTSLAKMSEKDALELFKSLRQATKSHVEEEPDVPVDESDLDFDPSGMPEQDDSEPEVPLPGSSKPSTECELCDYCTPYSTSMRRHMLVKHGLVQDITKTTKRAPKKRAAQLSGDKPKKKAKTKIVVAPKTSPKKNYTYKDKPILVIDRKTVRLKK